jgi:hypothetical protein
VVEEGKLLGGWFKSLEEKRVAGSVRDRPERERTPQTAVPAA